MSPSISRLNHHLPQMGDFRCQFPRMGDSMLMDCGDAVYKRHMSHNKYKNVKLINSIAFIAVIYASILVSTPQASAQTSRCSTNTLGSTYCSSSNGSRVRMSEDMFGNKTIRGTSLNGSSWKKRCTTNMLGKTSCW